MGRLEKIIGLGLTVAATLAPYTTDALLVSTIISGRGGATVALPTDTFVAAFNPAGMSWVGNRWDLGLNWQRDWGKAKISGNSDPNNNGSYDTHETENFFLPEFGVNRSICECRLTIGLIVYNRYFSKVTLDSSIPMFGTKKVGCEYLVETVSPVCTIRFGNNHALGVSIDLIGQRLKVNGLENFENSTRSDDPKRISNRGYQYSIGAGVTVGWMSRVSDCVTIGLAWAPEVPMSHISGYKGLLSHHGKFNLPQRFLGGFAVEFLPCAVFDFDVEYITWSSIPTLNHPLLPNFNEEPSFGGDDGAGLRWRDQICFRVGLEWGVTDYLAIRGGYSYARTPIKRKEAMLNILAPHIVEHYGTVGATWFIDCQNELSFFVAHGLRNTVNGENAIPDSLGGGNVNLKESKTMAGISWGRSF